jgi:hypothetical protein
MSATSLKIGEFSLEAVRALAAAQPGKPLCDFLHAPLYFPLPLASEIKSTLSSSCLDPQELRSCLDFLLSLVITGFVPDQDTTSHLISLLLRTKYSADAAYIASGLGQIDALVPGTLCRYVWTPSSELLLALVQATEAAPRAAAARLRNLGMEVAEPAGPRIEMLCEFVVGLLDRDAGLVRAAARSFRECIVARVMTPEVKRATVRACGVVTMSGETGPKLTFLCSLLSLTVCTAVDEGTAESLAPDLAGAIRDCAVPYITRALSLIGEPLSTLTCMELLHSLCGGPRSKVPATVQDMLELLGQLPDLETKRFIKLKEFILSHLIRRILLSPSLSLTEDTHAKLYNRLSDMVTAGLELSQSQSQSHTASSGHVPDLSFGSAALTQSILETRWEDIKKRSPKAVVVIDE